MPRHFADLTGAATLPTGTFQLAHRIVDDLVANNATGVIHGPAGTGKTYAVESALEDQAARGGPAMCALSFTARPTMRLVADHLLAALTGTEAQRHRPHLGRPENDPGGPPGRRPGLRDPRQPLRPPQLENPQVGGPEQGRAVLHPDLRVLGQPDRGPLRTATAVHPGQLEPSQPHRPDPSPARIPALAQQERPPPRRPRSTTTRTRSYPQRERHPLWRTTTTHRGLTAQPGKPSRSQH